MEQATILLVEDNEEIRDIMRELLEHAHYTVVTTTGSGAKATARNLTPDVILLDLYMPGDTDGESVYRQLDADPATRDIPVVLTSAVDNLGTVAKRLNVDSYLMKPYTLLMLMDKIDPLIEAHRAHVADQAHP